MAGGADVGFVRHTKTAARHFRADIQGLRAVAVVLVVVNHAYGSPAGGFVGVDVFYVISGYLITGLLLRELDQTGSVSLRAFYARRARRILPAALLVLGITVLTASTLWFAPRALQTLLDSTSAALFVSNWHFIAIGADYLQAGGAISPVQHYWSLSIEEQFYTIWPLALLLIFTLARRSRRVLTGIMIVGVIASLAWAAYRTGSDPAAAYFDTFARAWELLVGSLLALLGTAAPKGREIPRRIVAHLGVVLIIASAVIVQADWNVPFPWVAPSVLGSVMVIWANVSMGPRSLLGNRVAQWLGDISYSLYLWHFPVLIFAASVFGPHWWVSTLCVPVMLVVSTISRRFVEQPVMRSGFLKRASKLTNQRTFAPKDLIFGVAVAAAILVLSVAQIRGPGLLVSAGALAEKIGIAQATSSLGALSEEERRAQIDTALSASAWPEDVTRQLDTLYPLQQGSAMSMGVDGCRNNVLSSSPPRACGTPGGVEAMVVGDSVALSWVPTVETAASSFEWNVTAIGFANCSLIDVSVTNRNGDPNFRQACDDSRAKMFALIEEHRPAVVILSASESALRYTGLGTEAAAREWESGVTSTLAKLTAVPQVILLSNPPMSADPLECASRFASPASCVSYVSSDYHAKTSAEESAAASFPNVTYIDTAEWFCADGRCPAFVGGQILKTDVSHLTAAAASEVAPLFVSRILADRLDKAPD